MSAFTGWRWPARTKTTGPSPELSLQQTIGRLATRADAAESRLESVRRLHRPDPTGSWCVAGCRDPWPCTTLRLIDGTGCTSTDPVSGAVCDKPQGHVGRHGGMTRSGEWKSWL